MAEIPHELAEAVSSSDAVPGSGWVAGVAGGLAAALVVKVASRSEGWSGAEGARAQALDLRDRLLALAGQDARAYEQALTALEQRDTGLQRALERAAEVPLKTNVAVLTLLGLTGPDCTLVSGASGDDRLVPMLAVTCAIWPA